MGQVVQQAAAAAKVGGKSGDKNVAVAAGTVEIAQYLTFLVPVVDPAARFGYARGEVGKRTCIVILLDIQHVLSMDEMASLGSIAHSQDGVADREHRAAVPTRSQADAVAMVREGSGTHFDPSLVECFMEDADEFRYITAQFSDDADEEH
jgi:hypothetical protein